MELGVISGKTISPLPMRMPRNIPKTTTMVVQVQSWYTWSREIQWMWGIVTVLIIFPGTHHSWVSYYKQIKQQSVVTSGKHARDISTTLNPTFIKLKNGEYIFSYFCSKPKIVVTR